MPFAPEPRAKANQLETPSPQRDIGCHEGDEVWDTSSSASEVSTDSVHSQDGVPAREPAASAPCAGGRGRAKDASAKSDEGMPIPSRQEATAGLAKITVGPGPLEQFRLRPVAKHPINQDAGLARLVARLRRDNERLRASLVAAQREAEDQSSADEPAVDYAHLLALARDFGDGLGGGLGLDESGHDDADESCPDSRQHRSPSVQVFSMDDEAGCDSPCGVAGELEAARKEIAWLREELAASHREVKLLRAKILLSAHCDSDDSV